MPFPLTDYLSHLGLGAVPPGAAGLAALQRAQLASIPFENIDPLLGRIPDLDPAAIRHKLITARRGGYCFELNTLLGEALDTLGYTAIPLLAEVRMGRPAGGPRTHLAWRVTIGAKQWLIDAGFGGPGPCIPVPMSGEPVHAAGTVFRVSRIADAWMLERRTPIQWLELYAFDDTIPPPSQIEAANRYCATSDKSRFTFQLMLNRFTDHSRKSMLDTQLTIQSPVLTTRHLVDSESRLDTILTDVFALALPAEAVTAAWRKIAV